jgi:hypothetical protein
MRNWVVALAVSLCVICSAPHGNAASGPEIDASVRATLDQFFHEVWSSRDLANKAVAILIFPTIVKAGFGIGAEYGEGALHIRGRTAGYYNIISGSIGFQFGATKRRAFLPCGQGLPATRPAFCASNWFDEPSQSPRWPGSRRRRLLRHPATTNFMTTRSGRDKASRRRRSSVSSS